MARLTAIFSLKVALGRRGGRLRFWRVLPVGEMTLYLLTIVGRRVGFFLAIQSFYQSPIGRDVGDLSDSI